MIIVLPCSDILALITTHPAFLLYLVSWWTEDYNLLNKIGIYTHCTFIVVGFSIYSLLVRNTERYLAVYYPMFHWNSVTRRNLLTLLAILFLLHTTVVVITANDFIISHIVHFIIFMAIAFPPFMFVNYKLLNISRKLRLNNRISPEEKATKNWKNNSTCLLVVVCLVTLSIPSAVFLAFSFVEKWTTQNQRHYIYAMNSAFNCFIFLKNNILRRDGILIIKILKTLKDRFSDPLPYNEPSLTDHTTESNSISFCFTFDLNYHWNSALLNCGPRKQQTTAII